MQDKLMPNSKRLERVCYFILFAFVFGAYLLINTDEIYRTISPESMFADFRLRWQECAYVFRGANPYDIAHSMVPVNPTLGAMPDYAGSVPWAYLLGNIFVFGFLPYRQAVAMGAAWFLLIPFALGVFLFREFQRRNVELKFFWLAMGLIMLSPHWLISFRFGNYGSLLSCFLIAIPFLVDRHPYLAGILHALCMIKPQLAAPFYLYFLLTKRWKPLLLSGAIIGGAWGVVSMMVQRSPFSLLMDIYNTAMVDYHGSGTFGLFSMLPLPNATDALVVFSSAVAGVLFIVGAFVVIQKWSTSPEKDLLFYSAVVVASAFWFYKQVHDLVVIQYLFVYLVLAIQKLCSPALKLMLSSFAYLLCLELGFVSLSQQMNVQINLVRYVIWILLVLAMLMFSLQWAPIAKLRVRLCSAQPFRAQLAAFDEKPAGVVKKAYCAVFAIVICVFLGGQSLRYWQGNALLSTLQQNGTLISDTDLVQVYYWKDSLYYINTNLQNEYLRYYLHVVPEDEANLPEDRVQYGFSNYDSVLNNNMTRYSLFQPWKVNRFTLPPWSVAKIDTGEFGSADGAWSLTWAPDTV